MKVLVINLIAVSFFFTQICYSGITSTVCSSGCDFDNIQEAIDSIPADLSSSGGGIWTVEIETGDYSEDITVSGFSNASASDYIVIKAKSGHEHLGNFFAGVRILGTTASVNALDISTNYTQISNLVVYSNNKSSNYDCVQVTGTNTTLNQILAKVETYKNVKGFDVNVASAKISKCISWNSDNSTPWGGNQGFYLNASTEVYNSVAYRHGTGFWSGILKNCVSVNSHGSDFYVYQSGSEYNISSDETATDANDLTNQGLEDVNFDNIYLGDFRPVENSLLIGNGVDPSAGFSTDIMGETITDWMVGPFHSVDSNYNAHCNETTEYHIENGVDTIQSVINSIPDTLIHCGPQIIYVEVGDYNEDIYISGFVWPSDSDYIELRSESGDEHKGIYNAGVRIIGTSASTHVLNNSTDYTKLYDLVISTENKPNTYHGIYSTGKYTVFDRIFSKITNEFNSTAFYVNVATAKIYNSIAWREDTSAPWGSNMGFRLHTDTEVYNSLAYNHATGFWAGIVKNCVSANSYSNDFYVYNSSSDHNISEDGTANDTANGDIPNVTLAQLGFEDEGNGKFQPLSGSSILILNGTDLSSIFTSDIKLLAVENWSVGPFSNYLLSENLVGYWAFNEDTGDTLFDSTSNNDGILYNMDSSSWVSGVSGSSLYFDGSDDYVYFANTSNDLDIENQSWTVSAWINSEDSVSSTETSEKQTIVHRYECGHYSDCGNGQRAASWHLGIWNGGFPYFLVRDDQADYIELIDSSVNICDGNWRHMVGVLDRDGDSVKIYLDGEMQQSADASSINGINDSGSPLMFGKTKTMWGPESSIRNIYTGQIDEVRVYNVALTEDEIEALYNFEAPPGAKRGVPRPDPYFSTKSIEPKIIQMGNLIKIQNAEGLVKLYSFNGKETLVKNVKDGNFLDISSLNSGVYILTLNNIKMKIIR